MTTEIHILSHKFVHSFSHLILFVGGGPVQLCCCLSFYGNTAEFPVLKKGKSFSWARDFRSGCTRKWHLYSQFMAFIQFKASLWHTSLSCVHITQVVWGVHVKWVVPGLCSGDEQLGAMIVCLRRARAWGLMSETLHMQDSTAPIWTKILSALSSPEQQVCICVCLLTCLSTHLFVLLFCASIFLLVCLSTYLSPPPPICLPICLSFCLSNYYRAICLSVFSFICLSTCLSVCPSVCSSVCPFTCPSIRPATYLSVFSLICVSLPACLPMCLCVLLLWVGLLTEA